MSAGRYGVRRTAGTISFVAMIIQMARSDLAVSAPVAPFCGRSFFGGYGALSLNLAIESPGAAPGGSVSRVGYLRRIGRGSAAQVHLPLR